MHSYTGLHLLSVSPPSVLYTFTQAYTSFSFFFHLKIIVAMGVANCCHVHILLLHLGHLAFLL